MGHVSKRMHVDYLSCVSLKLNSGGTILCDEQPLTTVNCPSLSAIRVAFLYVCSNQAHIIVRTTKDEEIAFAITSRLQQWTNTN